MINARAMRKILIILSFGAAIPVLAAAYPQCECAVGPIDQRAPTSVEQCIHEYAAFYMDYYRTVGVCETLAVFDSSQPVCEYYELLTPEELAWINEQIEGRGDENP